MQRSDCGRRPTLMSGECACANAYACPLHTQKVVKGLQLATAVLLNQHGPMIAASLAPRTVSPYWYSSPHVWRNPRSGVFLEPQTQMLDQPIDLSQPFATVEVRGSKFEPRLTLSLQTCPSSHSLYWMNSSIIP